MTAPDPFEELTAAVDEAFLGWWPDDLMAIVRSPYRPNVLLAYAHRDGGRHLPSDDTP